MSLIALATQLTLREKQIVLLILEDNTSQAIAGKLNLSIRTVDTHRKHIHKKTNTHSVLALFKYAIQTGLTTEYVLTSKSSSKNTE